MAAPLSTTKAGTPLSHFKGTTSTFDAESEIVV